MILRIVACSGILFVAAGIFASGAHAAPSKAAYAAMKRGDPIPLADHAGAVAAGRPSNPKLPWKTIGGDWQRFDDSNLSAWRRGAGPVLIVSMASTHAESDGLELFGFGGATTSATGKREGILAINSPGLFLAEYNNFLYRFASGLTEFEIPLDHGRSVKFDLRDQVPLVEAAFAAGEWDRALALFKPFNHWPELHALRDRMWQAKVKRLADAGFEGVPFRELVQRGDAAWRQLHAQGNAGPLVFESTVIAAVRDRLAAGDAFAQAHARTLPIGATVSAPDATLDRMIGEGAALLEIQPPGSIELAVRRQLSARPVEWGLAPYAKDAPTMRSAKYLSAARALDRGDARISSALVAHGILQTLPDASAMAPLLARRLPGLFTAAARDAERAGWTATAAGLHLHAHQIAGGRVNDLAAPAPALGVDGESDVAAARRLVGGLLLRVWPKLSPAHPETARLVRLLGLGDRLSSAPAVWMLGLQPGAPADLLAAIARVRPADPVLAFSGYQRFAVAEKAEPVLWPRTFHAGPDPQDPAAVAWARVNAAEVALEVAADSHAFRVNFFNTAALEARLARALAFRDHYGSAHREEVAGIARGQGALHKAKPIDEAGLSPSLKASYDAAKRELQDQLAAGQANAESMRAEWNALDREADALAREIAERRRAVPDDAEQRARLAKLQSEVAAARRQLGAAEKDASRAKRFAHVAHDRHREDPLLARYIEQVVVLENAVRAKPETPERLAELQWLHWWLGIEDKAVPPLPAVSRPAPVANQAFVRARFFHEIETALCQTDAVTPMLLAIKNVRARSLPDQQDKLVRDGLLAFGLGAHLSESGELRLRLAKEAPQR